MLNLTETEKAYLAGLFDGEGSIGFYLTRTESFTATLCITNTDFRIMTWLQLHIPFGTIYSKAPNNNRRPAWGWKTSKREHVVEFLEAIKSYLVIKLDQAILLLSHLNAEQKIIRTKSEKLTASMTKTRTEVGLELKRLKYVDISSIH